MRDKISLADSAYILSICTEMLNQRIKNNSNSLYKNKKTYFDSVDNCSLQNFLLVMNSNGNSNKCNLLMFLGKLFKNCFNLFGAKITIAGEYSLFAYKGK